ncbi:acyl-CoA dehydrogenase family protein [Mycobacterium sp. C31M]
MNLYPDDDQVGIADAAQHYLATELPIGRIREMHSGAEAIGPAAWTKCAELGWLSLAVPEDEGGVGLGVPEESMLARELGRALTPGPFAATAIAAVVAAGAGQRELAGDLMAGTVRAGVAIGSGRVLDATPEGLVLSLSGDRAELYRIAALQPLDCVDPGARLHTAELGEVVAAVDDPLLRSRLLVWLSAQLLGVLEAVRDMSAAYAVAREQFGRPIGVYQAVKHRCADMAVGAYAVAAQVNAAAVMVQAGHPDAAFYAASAHRLAVARARTAASDNILNHGGIGFTWEHDSHLYLKRVELLDQAAGPRQDTWDALMSPPRHQFR